MAMISLDPSLHQKRLGKSWLIRNILGVFSAFEANEEDWTRMDL